MYPGRYYPGRVLSQPLRNLPGKVRNPDVRRTSETLRFECSGPIWQRVWISAGGRGRSGDTGTDGRLALPGNRGLPAKKRKLSFEAGLHDSEWSNVCSMETVECTTMESNASSAIRVLFPGPGRTGPDRGSDNPIPNTLCPKNKKPYVSLIHKVLLSAALFSYVSRVEEVARTLDLRNHNPTL